MAVAAPAMAVTSRICLAAAALLLLPADVGHAQAAPERCQPPLPVLQSDEGITFTADAYGVARWAASSNGRRLPYAVHVWKGRAGGERAYLTFDEIPGTSGPNYHIDTKRKRMPAQVDWTASRSFAFDQRIIIRSGPLASEWTVTNCAER